MRTGVHYFPKGVSNTIGIDSSNRFKCGLNRIEEKYDEVRNMNEKIINFPGNSLIFCHRTKQNGTNRKGRKKLDRIKKIKTFPPKSFQNEEIICSVPNGRKTGEIR